MLWIPLDKTSGKPLTRQIYEQIKKKILSGSLKGGEKLPSTRLLSAELQVSRNVVIEAYEILTVEGFVTSRTGSGTFVSKNTYLEKVQNRKIESPHPPIKTDPSTAENVIDFKPGVPALDQFPRTQWLRCYNEVIRESPPALFGYHQPEGLPELRMALALYLSRTRGIDCTADQIVITSGAAQAMKIISHLLDAKQGTLGLEDPGSRDLRQLFESQKVPLRFIGVDQQGIMTWNLPRENPPTFIYVTPSHQFPMGGMLPIQRRIELIQYARKHGTYLIEDDYDTEFRYDTRALSSLRELDPNLVIYVGTFSKILAPALRLGYMILPMDLVEECKRLKWYSDLHSQALDQMVLARFIEKGELQRLINRSTKEYKRKNETLLTALSENFSDLTLCGASTGLHLTVEFPPSVHWSPESLRQNRVRIRPLSFFSKNTEASPPAWVLGYGNLTRKEIVDGVKRIRRASETAVASR